MKNDIDQILRDYRDAAIAHGENSINGNYKTANKAYDKLNKILKRLVKMKSDALLTKLLNDNDPQVQLWASTHLLEVDVKKSIDTLKLLSAKNIPHISFDAKLVIQEWEKGNIKFR